MASSIVPRRRRRSRKAGAAETPPGQAISDLRARLQRLDRELAAALAADRRPDAASTLTAWLPGWLGASGLARLGAVLESFDAVRGADRADDFGLDPASIERVLPYVEWLYRTYWRVETRGLENVPASGAAMLVANHAGTLFPWDGVMLTYAVGREHPARRTLRPLVDDFVGSLPFIGSAMSRLGAVRACPENGERLLARGELIAVFPEGMRGISKPFERRYKLERFGRGGFAALAARCRAPIVPVAIVGAEEIHPMLAKIEGPARTLGLPYFPITPTFPWLGLAGLVPLPSKWTMVFGAPVDVAARFAADRPLDPATVDQVAGEIRATIQSMLDERLRARRSAFF